MQVPAVPSRLAALTLCGLLALTGCSSVLEPAAAGFDALPIGRLRRARRCRRSQRCHPPSRRLSCAAVTESIDRQLMTMSGLEAELGGAAQADAAYAALSAVARQFAQNLVDQPDFGRFGARIAAEDAPSIGGMMFGELSWRGRWLQDAAVTQPRTWRPAQRTAPQSEDLRDRSRRRPKGRSRSRATWPSRRSASAGSSPSTASPGSSRPSSRVAPCPDAKGQFTSTTTMIGHP